MSECIRQLCMLSVLFGILLDITPEGSVKKVSCIVCSAALITLILSGIKNTDVSDYCLETARYREMSAAITSNAQESGERLNRLVIQSECEEYIKDKAAALGVTDMNVKVTARWNGDGFWMPETVVLRGTCSPEVKMMLSDVMETELGVMKGNQIWSS